VRAQDTGGEALTFHLETGPTGMTIQQTTGVLRWMGPQTGITR
jgi:hypothetical protein